MAHAHATGPCLPVENWGTFDVPNYGDLLFPLILEAELRRRLPGLRLSLHSPRGGWFLPQPSRPVARLTRRGEAGFFSGRAGRAGIVLGGGDIVRFDDEALGPMYDLSPAQARRQRCYRVFVEDLGRLAPWLPVVWNAVGLPHPFNREEAALLRRALRHVAYLSVRDEPSRRLLYDAGVERDVAVVPDTALLVARHFPPDSLTASRQSLVAAGQFPSDGTVLCFQASACEAAATERLTAALASLLAGDAALRVVLLPTGPCHGDLALLQQLHGRLGPRSFLVREGSAPLTIAAVIAGSRIFAGCSLHGNLTAFAYGVRHLFLDFAGRRKVRGAADLLGAADWIVDRPEQLLPLFARLVGRPGQPGGPPPELVRRIDEHFDRLAEALERPASCRLGELGPMLDGLAEDEAEAPEEGAKALLRDRAALANQVAHLEGRAAALAGELAWARERISHLEQVIGAFDRERQELRQGLAQLHNTSKRRRGFWFLRGGSPSQEGQGTRSP